jgi:hypothetical protein
MVVAVWLAPMLVYWVAETILRPPQPLYRGIGVIPAALNVVGVLTTVVTILRADDPKTEVKNAVRDWAIDKVADRIVTAAVIAIV